MQAYLTDNHLPAYTPSSRVDDWWAAMMIK